MLSYLLLALLFIGSSVASPNEQHDPLVTVAHYEPVLNFEADVSNGQLTFTAYNTVWKFDIWLTDVHKGNREHFHGRLTRDPDSYASFSLIHPHVSGMILLGHDTYWIERRYDVDDTTLYIYKSSDVSFHSSMEFKCHAGHGDEKEEAEYPEKEEDQAIHTRDLDTRKGPDSPPTVAVWIDQYWANPNINPWASNQSTYLLFNDVNALYAASGLHGFTFNVMGQHSNSWSQNSQLASMLNSFSEFAATYGTLGTYDSGFWLMGNNVGGLAWIGTGCSTRNPPYFRTGIAGLNNLSRLYTVKTIAHELGHLRGAQHALNNQCAPKQSTNCQCSVMSFCFPTTQTYGGYTNYFAPVSIQQIMRSCP